MDYKCKQCSIKINHLDPQNLMRAILNNFGINVYIEYIGICEFTLSYIFRIFSYKTFYFKVRDSQIRDIIFHMENIDKYQTFLLEDSFEKGTLKFCTKG